MRLFTVSALMAMVAFSPATRDAQFVSAQVVVGSKAPDLELPTLSGAPMRLSALRGHSVVVTFWGTWCPPCRDEFPWLVAAYKKHHDAGLEIIAVNQRDQEFRLTDVQNFVRALAVSFPVALDEKGRSRRSYRLIGLPTTVFIDTAGTIVRVQSGPLTEDQLANGLTMIVRPH